MAASYVAAADPKSDHNSPTASFRGSTVLVSNDRDTACYDLRSAASDPTSASYSPSADDANTTGSAASRSLYFSSRSAAGSCIVTDTYGACPSGDAPSGTCSQGRREKAEARRQAQRRAS